MLSALIPSLYFIYLIALVGIGMVVIFEHRNPVKISAWALVILFLPILGLILYLFFGQDKRRKIRISNRRKNQLKRYIREDRRKLPDLRQQGEKSALITMLYNNADATLYTHNRVTFFTTGEEKFNSLKRHLLEAKDHIHLQYYIIANDRIGNEIKTILIEKARAGVEVRVLYDDLGSWGVDKQFFRQMKEAGVHTSNFLPVTFKMLTSRINYRNHRKVVVIDGKYGYLGGMNIADRYVAGNALGAWRDTHALIEGRAVHGLQSAFLVDWYFSEKRLLTAQRYFPSIGERGAVSAQIVTGGPFGVRHELNQALFKAIVTAERYIYIQTPYLMPTDSILLALQTAGLSGVDVRVMIPENSDTPVTNIGNRSYVKELLTSGVKVYFYTQGFLHSKTLVIDDTLSIVGSTNLDFRSLEHNFEINAFLYDPDTAKRLRRIFETDMASCRRVHYKEWSSRPRRLVMVESVVRLFSRLL